MADYYDALGISRGATPAVVKIGYEGRLKGLAKEKLSPQERKAEERVLQQAFATLSDPAKKAWYDKQLDASGEEDDAAAAPVRSKAPLVFGAGLVAVVAMAAVGWYVSHPSAQKREQARQEEDARARKAYDDKMNSVGSNKNPNPFRGGPPSAVKDQLMKNAIERDAQARAKGGDK